MEYTRRRWDVYHLFSSEKVSIILGLALGWTSRIAYGIYKKGLSTCFLQNSINSGELFVILFVTSIGIVIFFRMGCARKWVNTQYDYVSTAIIRSSQLEAKNLVDIFAPDFFDTSILDTVDEKVSKKLRAEEIYSVSDLVNLSQTKILKL